MSICATEFLVGNKMGNIIWTKFREELAEKTTDAVFPGPDLSPDMLHCASIH